jgi:hypothetical protein
MCPPDALHRGVDRKIQQESLSDKYRNEGKTMKLFAKLYPPICFGSLLLAFATILLFLYACDSYRKIPFNIVLNPSKLNIEAEVTEVIHGKNVKGGMLVRAKAFCPHNIKNDQIKPVAVQILNELKAKYPNCEWFFVWISDDRRMDASGNYIAIAELKEGKTQVRGGIPSKKEIAESDKDWPIIKPTDKDMDIYYEFTKMFDNSYYNSYYIGKRPSEKEIYLLLSQKFHLSASEISRIHKGVAHYYMLKSGNDL